MMEKNLTSGTPWKLIFSFSVPVLIGLLLQQLYNTVDTIVVGNFANEAALSAVGTTGSLVFLWLAVANGFASGAGVITSQYYGAGETGEMRKTAGTAISLLLIMGLAATALGILTSYPAFRYLLGVPDSFRSIAVQYFNIYCFGLVFEFGYNIVAALLRSVGDSKASMYFLLVSSLTNIILDLVFVAGFRMSAVGAAIATDLSQMLSCVVSFIYMLRRYPVFRFTAEELKPSRSCALRIVKVGFPIMLQQMIAALGTVFIQRAVNSYGQTMTASFTVGSRIEMYVQMPLNAFYMALATYVGQNIGAGKMDRVRQGARQTILLSFMITLFIAFCVIVFENQLIGLFGISKEAAFFCRQHLKVTALAFVLQAVYLPLFGVFQGAGDGFAITRTAIVALSIRVLTAYTLCYMPLFGYRIVWWNTIFGFTGGFIITWAHYLSGKWTEKAIIKGR